MARDFDHFEVFEQTSLTYYLRNITPPPRSNANHIWPKDCLYKKRDVAPSLLGKGNSRPLVLTIHVLFLALTDSNIIKYIKHSFQYPLIHILSLNRIQLYKEVQKEIKEYNWFNFFFKSVTMKREHVA